ncbi:MAG: hypothetical protein JGK29_32545 [Microcoleus sp. PH2017_17_BER_D_A]|nr:hypothetical protein [Microcoleus sp. PH2017_17_BER_D_A]
MNFVFQFAIELGFFLEAELVVTWLINLVMGNWLKDADLSPHYELFLLLW